MGIIHSRNRGASGVARDQTDVTVTSSLHESQISAIDSAITQVAALARPVPLSSDDRGGFYGRSSASLPPECVQQYRYAFIDFAYNSQRYFREKVAHPSIQGTSCGQRGRLRCSFMFWTRKIRFPREAFSDAIC